MENERKLTLKYCALQTTYWLMAAVGMAFITPLLEAKGFSSTEIGWLNGIKYTSVIFFQIFIASFSDKHITTIPLKWIMNVLAIISIVASGLFWISDNNFIVAVIVFIALGATINCLSPIVDSLSIQYMNQGRKFNYTLSRACGSGAWAISCIAIGIFSDYCGVNNILLLQIVAAILFICVCTIMDKVDFSEKKEKGKEKKRVNSSMYLLMHYPKYTLFLISCMIIFMGYNLNATFIIDLMKELGGSHTQFGMGEFVLALSEIPVALFFLRMRKYLSIDQLMIVCSVFCTLRAAATAFAPTAVLLIASQSLEILGLSIFYAGSVYFVMDNLPDTDVVKGVSFINVASVGIGQAIASVSCGMIKSALGLHRLMICSVIVSFMGIVVMIIMKFAPKEKNNP